MSKSSHHNGPADFKNNAASASLPREWLVFRLSSLGDVALITGPMRFWHEEKGLVFTVLTKPAFAPLFAHNPAVKEVISPQNAELHLPGMPAYFRSLAASRKGWGLLDLHGTIRSRLLGLFWQGPVRRYPKFSAQRRAYLLRKSPRIAQTLREFNVTRRYAMALEEAPPLAERLVPVIYVTDEERRAARARIAETRNGARSSGSGESAVFSSGQQGNMAFSSAPDKATDFSPGPHAPVALHPYATHRRKAWPAEYWRRLTRDLDRSGISWFVVGQGEGLFPGDPRDLTGKTSLRELCALLAEARAVVSGDSGPMHLAAAVGTPVLGLFGPTTREWGFFPAGKADQVFEADLPCRPCSLHGADRCRRDGECMKKIEPRAVFERLLGMLETK